jgi:ADP-heptose:LPS heptosyltransferase
VRALHRALTAPATAVRVFEPVFRRLGRRSESAPAPAEADRILLVLLGKIGDVVLASGLVRELRAARPDARIDAVVRPETASLVSRCPHLDAAIPFRAPAGGRFWRLARHRAALALAVSRLLPARYDLALCPRYDADLDHGAFVAYLSGAPRRAGWTEVSTPARAAWNRGEDVLFTDRMAVPGTLHEAARNLIFLGGLGFPVRRPDLEVWTTPEDEEAAAEVAPAGAEFALLAPGAGEPKRRWPLDRFAELGRRLLAERGGEILVTGDPGEREAAAALARSIGRGARSVAGLLDLPALAALAGRARVVVAADSGPLHLAAAAGAPVVGISCHPADGDPDHPNSPLRFGPLGELCAVVRPERTAPPCRGGCEADRPHCILGVSVADVASRIPA